MGTPNFIAQLRPKLFIIFQKIPLLVSVIPLQFAKSSILWNPIIYVWKNKTVNFVIFMKSRIFYPSFFSFKKPLCKSFQFLLKITWGWNSAWKKKELFRTLILAGDSIQGSLEDLKRCGNKQAQQSKYFKTKWLQRDFRIG